MRVLAESHCADTPPIAGFVISPFSLYAAEAAARCVAQVPHRPLKTAVVIVSEQGDLPSATHVAAVVDAGDRVGPLMFFQSVPNAVAGHIAARWGLRGPVLCISPDGDPRAAGLELAELLIDDGDADAALVVQVFPDSASALLIGEEAS